MLYSAIAKSRRCDIADAALSNNQPTNQKAAYDLRWGKINIHGTSVDIEIRNTHG